MFFRNLTMFRFPRAIGEAFQPQSREEGASFEMLEPFADAALTEHRLKPVGPLELSSIGFALPFGTAGDVDEFVVRTLNTDARVAFITVAREDKILPAAVVNSLLAQRLDDLEQREGRRPGGRARKRLKDDLVHELLPKALVKPSRVNALIDLEHGVVAVDTSSRRVAEGVISLLRHALGSFPALPINAEIAPRSVLTGWIAGEPLPDGLSIGEECELREATDRGAVVRCQRQDLAGGEITEHLESGKQVTRLALNLDDHVSLVLGEDLAVRKLALLDGATLALEDGDHDDQRAELQARAELMAAEFHRLFAVLEGALRLSRVEG